MRAMRRRTFALAALACSLPPGLAAAGVSGFRLSEVVTASASGNPASRYIELEATAEACVFPSTRIVSYDASGAVIGDVGPFASATCVAPGTFLLLATPAAQAEFATGADGSLVPTLAPIAGQVCLVSTGTRYDCVRWGPIATPVRDLFGPTDDTSAPAPPGAIALARVAETHVVDVDWRTETPTPRGPNDGSPWDPSDAGIDGPLADAGVDAFAVDAPSLVDAPAPIEPDASQRFLDLDPGGGATCGCAGSQGPGWALGLVVLALVRRRRRR